MLTKHLRLSIAAAAALVVGYIVVVPAPSAEAAYCVGDGGQLVDCEIEGGGGGGGSQPGEPVVTDPGAAVDIPFTPGPTTCTYGGEEIPCSSEHGAWNSQYECYMDVQTPQPEPRQGGLTTGAWYDCRHTALTGAICADRGEGLEVGCFTTNHWLTTPPPGVNRYSPWQAAAILVSRFQLRAIDVGAAPDPAAGQEAVIGVPVWLWVENPTDQTWGPYVLSDTLGGVAVSATAQVQSVTWTLGDGNTVQCGLGTEYSSSYGISSSPTCGHTYQQVPDGGSYDITARTVWTINWQADGVTGSTQVNTASAPTTLPVIQFQSVNVPNP